LIEELQLETKDVSNLNTNLFRALTWPPGVEASYLELRFQLERFATDLDCIDRNLSAAKPKARKPRGWFVRNALSKPEKWRGWWPAKPTNEDLAALSILHMVPFEDFSTDFKRRDDLARRAAGDSGQATHLYGFIHNEAKRCGGLRPKTPPAK